MVGIVVVVLGVLMVRCMILELVWVNFLIWMVVLMVFVVLVLVMDCIMIGVLLFMMILCVLWLMIMWWLLWWVSGLEVIGKEDMMVVGLV